MYKVLVFSDSHGSLHNIKKVLKKNKDIDLLIHLGDIGHQEEELRMLVPCGVRIFKGNCDWGSTYPDADVFNVGPIKIFASHGHQYGVNYGYEKLYYTALENECNVALFGHTHVPLIDEGDKVTIANPGSIERPRQYEAKPSYLTIEIEDDGECSFEIKTV